MSRYFCPTKNYGVLGSSPAPKFDVLKRIPQERDKVVFTDYQRSDFSEDWPDQNEFEKDLREAIERTAPGVLKLSRADGVFIGVSHGQSVFAKRPIYQLESDRHKVRLELQALKYKGCFGNVGLEFYALMMSVAPQDQGNFFRLRDFMRLVLETVLNGLKSHNVYRMSGNVLPNTAPIRATGGEDWRFQITRDGCAKLARLYEHLGFVRIPSLANRAEGMYSGDTMVVFSKAGLALLELESPREGAWYREQLSDNDGRRVKRPIFGI